MCSYLKQVSSPSKILNSQNITRCVVNPGEKKMFPRDWSFLPLLGQSSCDNLIETSWPHNQRFTQLIYKHICIHISRQLRNIYDFSRTLITCFQSSRLAQNILFFKYKLPMSITAYSRTYTHLLDYLCIYILCNILLIY